MPDNTTVYVIGWGAIDSARTTLAGNLQMVRRAGGSAAAELGQSHAALLQPRRQHLLPSSPRLLLALTSPPPPSPRPPPQLDEKLLPLSVCQQYWADVNWGTVGGVSRRTHNNFLSNAMICAGSAWGVGGERRRRRRCCCCGPAAGAGGGAAAALGRLLFDAGGRA